MELTITSVVMLVGGLLALSIGIMIYMHFNGGIENNIQMLLGVI